MSFADNVAVAANVAQILGAVGTVGGIFYAAAQLRHNASTSRATFLLELEKCLVTMTPSIQSYGPMEPGRKRGRSSE